jgi:hypothetical protein
MKLALLAFQHSETTAVRGLHQDWQDAPAFFAGLPPVKRLGFCPDVSQRSTLCEISQLLLYLFSQSYHL